MIFVRVSLRDTLFSSAVRCYEPLWFHMSHSGWRHFVAGAAFRDMLGDSTSPQNTWHHLHATAKALFTPNKWSKVLRTFYRQILSLLYIFFSSETSAPGSPGNYLYLQGFWDPRVPGGARFLPWTWLFGLRGGLLGGLALLLGNKLFE